MKITFDREDMVAFAEFASEHEHTVQLDGETTYVINSGSTEDFILNYYDISELLDYWIKTRM